jgi:hypothetical protein
MPILSYYLVASLRSGSADDAALHLCGTNGNEVTAISNIVTAGKTLNKVYLF